MKKDKDWVFIDASNKILGKLAADISKKLMAKDKSYFAPHQVLGSKVVVTNAKNIAVTGDKMTTKVYIRYTGFPKGLRSETLAEVVKKDPTKAIRRAVSGMLPKNKLQKKRLANLYIYPGEKHPHMGQENKQV